MRGNDDAVSDLAGAALDGTPIDWTAAESGADEARRALLAELKVLFTLAEAHRRFQGLDGTEWPPQAAGLTRIVDALGTSAHPRAGRARRVW